MIKGGYFLKARKIQESDIAHAPPHVREIWDLLLRKCSYSDGNKLQRGQCYTSHKQIINELCWYVGYRKEAYSLTQCENATKWLKKAGMITTTRTTRGMIVTVCNYDYYQNPKNYECWNESRTENRYDAGVMPDDSKEGKELKNKELLKRENEFKTQILEFKNGYSDEMIDEFLNHWTEPNKSKTKLRFELEKTWDTSRRLKKWEANSKRFNHKTDQGSKGPAYKILNEPDEIPSNYNPIEELKKELSHE